MDLTITAEDDGEATAVTVQIASPLGDVLLSGGDTLRVSAGGEAHTLSVERSGREIRYLLSLPSGEASLLFDLTRSSDRSIEGVEITMPPPFSLTVLDVPAGGPISLVWDGAEGAHTTDVVIEGSCVETLTRRLAHDTGAYSVDPAELVPAAGGGFCPLDVTLTRTIAITGQLLKADDGGQLTTTAVERRTARIDWGS